MADRVAATKRAGKLLYLYGVTERAATVRTGEGVDGSAAVESLSCAGFVCWISRVDPKEYGEELQAHMENLDWLAGASVRHQKVVGAIHAKATILPARFATIFLSEDSLGADLKRRTAELRKDFKRLADCDEYGLKVFGIPQEMPAGETPKSGRSFLERKAEMLRDRTPMTLTPEVKKFVAEMRKLASQVAEGGNITSGQRHLLWQGSFLFARSRRQQLETALAGFHRKHAQQYRVECTGPWPPYSFVAIKAGSKSE